MAPWSPLEPIKKGLSRPLNPTAPSLLTLHPEIRNTIYDALFHVPRGVRISPGAECDAENMFEDKSIHESIASSLPLLLTCRQVYHEAASLLMSSNCWVVSRNQTEAEEFLDSEHQVWQAARAAKWMSCLGSRIFMLRNIVLDLNMKWAETCRGLVTRAPQSEDNEMELDSALKLSALLKQLWSLPGPDIQVKFAYLRIRDEPHCQPDNHTSQCQNGFAPKMLTTLFQTLMQDPLGLRTYGRQLEEIWVQRDCSEGCVGFQGGTLVERRFSILDEGRAIKWMEKTNKPTFASLTARVQHRIYLFVNHPPWSWDRSRAEQLASVSWDLNKGAVTGASPVLLSVSQQLRESFLGDFWQRNWHRITIGSNQVITDFDKFKKLELFWCTRKASRHPWDPGNTRARVGMNQYPFEFILEFQVNPQVRLEDLRINIVHFLHITSSITGDARITVSIVDAYHETRDQSVSSLEKFRALSLLALSELENHQPGWMSAMCPAIWMNGLAEIVRVESAYTSHDVHATVKQYMPYCNHRKRLLDTYTRGIDPRNEYDEKQSFKYTRSQPSFDGSLRFYLGYLQRAHMNPSPRFWAMKYFAKLNKPR